MPKQKSNLRYQNWKSSFTRNLTAIRSFYHDPMRQPGLPKKNIKLGSQTFSLYIKWLVALLLY